MSKEWESGKGVEQPLMYMSPDRWQDSSKPAKSFVYSSHACEDSLRSAK